tara:strand:- start:371 stop:508 length:138 start_codon:yes stop_codon:yes gene_type:complete
MTSSITKGLKTLLQNGRMQSIGSLGPDISQPMAVPTCAAGNKLLS